MSSLNDILIEKVNARGLKPASLKTYKNNLKNFLIHVNIELNSLEDINSNIEKIVEYLNSIESTSVKKNYVNPLILLLSLGKGVPDPKYKESYDKLFNILDIELRKYRQTLEKKQLTEKQDKIFLEYDEIVNITTQKINDFLVKYPNIKSYVADKSITPDEAKQLVIVALYSYLPPRRTIYAQTQVITLPKYSKLTEEELDNNIYLVHKGKIAKFFHYGREVVKSRTLVNEIVEIKNKYLIKILEYYLKKTKSKLLFPDRFGKPIDNNYFGKLLTRVFQKYHKKALNVVLLRKIYLMKYSDLQNDYSIKEALEDARMMNHSIITQQQVYVKNKPINVENIE